MTHSFPTRRSSDLRRSIFLGRRDFAIDVIGMAAPHTLLDAWPAALAIYSITRRTMLILCAGHEISLARVGIAQKSGYGLRLMLQKPVLQPSGGKGSQCHAREDAGQYGTPCDD